MVHVSDTNLKELRRIWLEDKFRVYSILEYLEKKFGIKKTYSWERLVLYGRTKDNKMHESMIGFLIAIAPGIVMLNTGKDELLFPLSGLLSRTKPSHGQLFEIRPFSPPSFQASLRFLESKGGSKERFKTCPVYVNWNIGSRQGNGYGYIGIDPARWEIMRQWLDKWLPEPK